MMSSIPLTSRAKKQSVVIQWVTRTTAVCRCVFVTAGAAETRLARQTESATQVCYQRFFEAVEAKLSHPHKCGEPVDGRERAEQAGRERVACNQGITLRPVAMIVPEEVDQHARGPEYGNEAGDRARRQVTCQK